jgi:uncharacterized membrane protein
MNNDQHTILHTIIKKFWSFFLSGLITILPITITFFIFNIVFKFINNFLEPLRVLIEKTPLTKIPYVEFFIAIVLVFTIGIIYKIFIMRSAIKAVESFLAKVPLVRSVYSGIKQLVHALSVQDKLTFLQVVIIEFPRKDLYSIGFLTSKLTPDLAPEPHKKFFNIYIPTTPNPTSGFHIILPEHEVRFINLSRQEAMALIISGGIIQPERFEKKPIEKEQEYQ